MTPDLPSNSLQPVAALTPLACSPAERRFISLYGHPGENWTPQDLREYRSKKALFIHAWNEAPEQQANDEMRDRHLEQTPPEKGNFQ